MYLIYVCIYIYIYEPKQCGGLRGLGPFKGLIEAPRTYAEDLMGDLISGLTGKNMEATITSQLVVVSGS